MDFLNNCSLKDYSDVGTHKHHILPKKFMGGSDHKENIIVLSYDDHFDAHVILANCFEKNQIEYYKNMYSASRLLRWVDRGDEIRMILSEMNLGEKNPAFGRKSTDEERQWRSERFSGERNPMYGKKHTDESKKQMSIKKSGSTHTDESKKQMSKSHQIFLETDEGKLWIEQCRVRMTGKKFGPCSDETKSKISNANKGTVHPIRTHEQNQKIVTSRRNNGDPWHSEETKQKISMSKKGACSVNRKCCSVNGMMFDSVIAAARYFGKSSWYVSERIKSDSIEFASWIYV